MTESTDVTITVQDAKLQRKAFKSVLWLCAICLAFAFICIFAKVDPTQKMLDFIVWIVGLTFVALTGSEGIELLKPKGK